MKLNDDKFEVLRYGTNNELKESTTYTTPKGLPIETKTVVKDLGVVMSDENKFNKQIDHVITKAKNMASWILRTPTLNKRKGLRFSCSTALFRWILSKEYWTDG